MLNVFKNTTDSSNKAMIRKYLAHAFTYYAFVCYRCDAAVFIHVLQKVYELNELSDVVKTNTLPRTTGQTKDTAT